MGTGVPASLAGPAILFLLCRLSENFWLPSCNVRFSLSSALKIHNLKWQFLLMNPEFLIQKLSPGQLDSWGQSVVVARKFCNKDQEGHKHFLFSVACVLFVVVDSTEYITSLSWNQSQVNIFLSCCLQGKKKKKKDYLSCMSLYITLKLYIINFVASFSWNIMRLNFVFPSCIHETKHFDLFLITRTSEQTLSWILATV